ncbi:hypothetical protein [Streptomyces sp. TRM49041]|uniref:hypothetical protein n=1 Tax=Streptomyces sp. TRM49041 TaxID=2603216 RepID=UPI0011EE6031|nr:hypothetical protein [Streptomyces sp. TRM49041]
MTLHASRVATADRHVTVISHTPAITVWSQRYFGAWWNATRVTAPYTGPVVYADVAPGEARHAVRCVRDSPHDTCTYAGSEMLYRRDHQGVIAVQPDHGLAYRYDPDTRRLRITGSDDTRVAMAAARLARELVRASLLADGWVILHASAAVKTGGAVLTLGDKGAGKTTTALLLARAGYRLLANDRVFARVEDGEVRVLPWPAAAAIGLGLLDALGLYDDVRARVLAGEGLHPTQHPRVTQALLGGHRRPLRQDNGKELKPQFFPDQLTAWLGMRLATEAHAAMVLFPRIDPDGTPSSDGPGRGLAGSDLFTAATEDRYPDVFGLTTAASRTSRQGLAAALAALPSRSITLGHDTKAGTEFLAEAADPHVEDA